MPVWGRPLRKGMRLGRRFRLIPRVPALHLMAFMILIEGMIRTYMETQLREEIKRIQREEEERRRQAYRAVVGA